MNKRERLLEEQTFLIKQAGKKHPADAHLSCVGEQNILDTAEPSRVQYIFGPLRFLSGRLFHNNETGTAYEKTRKIWWPKVSIRAIIIDNLTHE